MTEWRKQQATIDREEGRADKAKQEADQKTAALDAIIAAAIQLPLPEFEGIIGAWAHAQVDAFSDPVSKQIEGLWQREGKHAEPDEAANGLQTSLLGKSDVPGKLLGSGSWSTAEAAEVADNVVPDKSPVSADPYWPLPLAKETKAPEGSDESWRRQIEDSMKEGRLSGKRRELPERRNRDARPRY